ncbi:MAG: hypothetical protein P8179_02085 [Candidatus Thiodiazotropha sp.]|jgi:hypothetical protein
MAKFIPCQGKTACREDKDGCKTCGRTTNEIIRLRELLDQLCTLADEYDYSNIDEYAGYIQRKLEKMISYRRKNQVS